jgi:hypothetical protein
MQRSRWFFAVFLLLLLASGLNGQHIHVLMVVDTADGGGARRASVDRVTSAFRYLVPDDMYSLKVLDSTQTRYNANSVLRTIRGTRVGRDDTFVFLYHGHGANDGRTLREQSDRHFLNMPDGGRLWSDDLGKAVGRMPCRLGVVLTAACNVSVRPSGAAAARAEEWDVDRNGIAPVMDELFLNHRGLLHSNGAWPGQFHFYNDEGAWFFQEFFGFCVMSPTARPTWKAVDALMDRRMAERFKAEYPHGLRAHGASQDTLHPITWSYATPTVRRSLRLGVVADDDYTRTGVTVTQVNDGPAKRISVFSNGDWHDASLQKGDVLLAINGEEIRDIDDYVTLVPCSSRTFHFTFSRGGRVYDAQTRLNW